VKVKLNPQISWTSKSKMFYMKTTPSQRQVEHHEECTLC